MTRIRVLRLIDRLNVGGPALQVSVLAERLDPTRFQQVLLTGDVDPAEGDYVTLRAPDLSLERIRGLGRSPDALGDAHAFRQIDAVIRRFRPHIVHTHKAKAGVLGRPAAWLRRVPATVHTFHGHLLHGYFSPVKTKAVVGVERILSRPTTRLVAVGARVRDELVSAGIGRRDQYTVVPPGVELGPLPTRSEARVALGLPLAAPLVTFVGRLARVKRPDRFVDVALRVARTEPDAVFAVVGDGEMADEVRARAGSLGERFVFLGWRSDVETVYAASDVVALTSDNEGMPVSLIEAATAGVPVVTTDVGSAAEVVEQGVTGLVVPPDTAALADAVTKLLGDARLRRRLGEDAKMRAQRMFSADRLVADLSELYYELATGRTVTTGDRA